MINRFRVPNNTSILNIIKYSNRVKDVRYLAYGTGLIYNNNNNKNETYINNNNGSQFKRYHRREFNHSRSNFPSGDSGPERTIFGLIGIGSLCLLGYVLYDNLEEMIVENIIYNQTIEQLRNSKSINKVFKEDFSAHGLGIRAQYSIKKTLEDPSIFIVYYTIRGHKDLVGHVSAKLHRVSTFGFETDILKVTYGNGKVITVISEEKKFAKQISNRAQKMFSFLIPKLSNNNNNNNDNSNNNNNNKSNDTQQDQGMFSTILKVYNDISNYFSNDPPKDK